MTHPTIRRLALAISLAAGVPAAAYAQDLTQEERAAGEKLYEDGTRLLAEKKYAEACPLLARAVEVVKRQGIGGLLALAECREGEGKFGSAWTLYREAASKAEVAGQGERARIAKDGEARVAPRVHYVIIENGAELASTAGVEVIVQGARVSPGVLTAPVAVDPGALAIEVRAPGRAPSRTDLSVPSEGGTTKTTIQLGQAEGSNGPSPKPAPAPAPPEQSSELGGGQIAGLVIGSVGLAAIFTGTALFAIGKASYPAGCETADGSFDRAACGNPDDIAAANDARTLGNASAGTFYPGLGLFAAGLVVFLVSPPATPTAEPTTPALRLGAPGADVAGLSIGAAW